MGVTDRRAGSGGGGGRVGGGGGGGGVVGWYPMTNLSLYHTLSLLSNL